MKSVEIQTLGLLLHVIKFFHMKLQTKLNNEHVTNNQFFSKVPNLHLLKVLKSCHSTSSCNCGSGLHGQSQVQVLTGYCNSPKLNLEWAATYD
jgi:hypothetical protein